MELARYKTCRFKGAANCGTCKDVKYQCLLGLGLVRHEVECQPCPSYEAFSKVRTSPAPPPSQPPEPGRG